MQASELESVAVRAMSELEVLTKTRNWANQLMKTLRRLKMCTASKPWAPVALKFCTGEIQFGG